jgi:hypothetical protein
MIVRVSKEDRLRFVILDITAARDRRLSWAAVGVHTYLMTMADGWEVRIPQLLDFRGSNGRDALRNIFKELEGFGYAELRRIMEGAKIVGSEWIIFEKPCKPHDAPTDGISGGRDSRPPENQSPENPSLFKEDQGTKNDQSKYMLISEEQQAKKADTAETIYGEYPRKVSKPQALKAIRTALKKVGFDELLKAVQGYAATVKAAGTEQQFIPYPATWFNGERWNDHTTHTKHEPRNWQTF